MCGVDHPQFYGSVLIHVGGVATPKFEIFAWNFSNILKGLHMLWSILESEQQDGIWIFLVISNLGVAAPPTWIRTDP